MKKRVRITHRKLKEKYWLKDDGWQKRRETRTYKTQANHPFHPFFFDGKKGRASREEKIYRESATTTSSCSDSAPDSDAAAASHASSPSVFFVQSLMFIPSLKSFVLLFLHRSMKTSLVSDESWSVLHLFPLLPLFFLSKQRCVWHHRLKVVLVPSSSAIIEERQAAPRLAVVLTVIMSVRRMRGSFRGSLRRFGSAESRGGKVVRHHTWIYKHGEWRIAYGMYSFFAN